MHDRYLDVLDVLNGKTYHQISKHITDHTYYGNFASSKLTSLEFALALFSILIGQISCMKVFTTILWQIMIFRVTQTIQLGIYLAIFIRHLPRYRLTFPVIFGKCMIQKKSQSYKQMVLQTFFFKSRI